MEHENSANKQRDFEHWTLVEENHLRPSLNLYQCKFCDDTRPQLASNIKKHEGRQSHQDAVELHITQRRNSKTDHDGKITDDSLRHLLASMARERDNLPPLPYTRPMYEYGPMEYDPPSPVTGIQWNLSDTLIPADYEPSPSERVATAVSKAALDILNGDIEMDDFLDHLSDEEMNEDVEESNGNDDAADAELTEFEINQILGKRRRTAGKDEDEAKKWKPWPDRITCTLDILMHLPRSVFSQKQLDLFLWILKVNGVSDVPSTKQLKSVNQFLQRACGIRTIHYKGAQGNPYSVNSLADILAQEFANPQVRPHLSVYPEDNGSKVSEAKHADQWLRNMPDDRLTPMVRHDQQDFYIFEPAVLTNNTFVIPFRWFERNGAMFGRCWAITKARPEGSSEDGWRVWLDNELEVPVSRFAKNFPNFTLDYHLYGTPDPRNIIDIRSSQNPEISQPWIHTNPQEGNSWRKRAEGKRVMAVPLWLYCDDTSGNLSKKWNAHNSYLFTLAGLPREHAQKEYNVHYLCTSNLAPPLEMLEGVVEQIIEAQRNGIWAWDYKHKEPVLIFPTVLALLGDNPMQSEFACHIGLRGNLFCRVCEVSGQAGTASDIANNPEVPPLPPAPGTTGSANSESPPSAISANPGSTQLEETASDAESDAGTDNQSDTESVAGSGAAKKSRKKAGESLEHMRQRVIDFLKVGVMRTREKTQNILMTYLAESSRLGTRTSTKKMRTETGIKDTYLEYHLDRLYGSYQKKPSVDSKQAALAAAVSSLPDNVTSPVWKIKELDPHRDTLVEILHVVLLGFVKYFWRDLIQNQLKNNDEKKALLVQRLNSFDVSGLGISPLAGQTLVQYSGSLTGRDFRAIAQIAPFVIYDLVPDTCMAAWVSLSSLIPFIYTPAIDNIDTYTTDLTILINQFLLRTTNWTNRWFNKPKFHILLHLPAHVKQFGPAMLFATESFESFNAVIRAKSIHTNRQAPSRDIALAFAQGNRIRHIMSGGLFLTSSFVESSVHSESATLFSHKDSDWDSFGPGPQSLLRDGSTVLSYLGLASLKNSQTDIGTITLQTPLQKIPFSQSLTSRFFSHHAAGYSSLSSLCSWATSAVIANQEQCKIGSYVVFQLRAQGERGIGCVQEILVPSGHRLQHKSMLIQHAKVKEANVYPYGMPSVELVSMHGLYDPADIKCIINAPHNCHSHQCTPSGTRRRRLERQLTENTVLFIQHIEEPHDRLLNLGKMRDVCDLAWLRANPVLLPLELTVQTSCVRELERSKNMALELSEGVTGRGRGRGRGRGQGRGRGRGQTPTQLAVHNSAQRAITSGSTSTRPSFLANIV